MWWGRDMQGTFRGYILLSSTFCQWCSSLCGYNKKSKGGVHVDNTKVFRDTFSLTTSSSVQTDKRMPDFVLAWQSKVHLGLLGWVRHQITWADHILYRILDNTVACFQPHASIHPMMCFRIPFSNAPTKRPSLRYHKTPLAIKASFISIITVSLCSNGPSDVIYFWAHRGIFYDFHLLKWCV